MNSLGFAEDSLASGIGAVLTGVTKGPVESATGQVLARNGGMLLAGGEIASLIAGPGDRSEVKITLTPVQRMIQEILDPLALPKRPVKEWRNHYKTFFAFFAPEGDADETERKAWAIAADVFNTNLVAVCNRTTQVVPMTLQDFADGVDSFRHDGLREGAQRDIAWQPKKILLLMAAMIGRILAGWQADVGQAQATRQPLFPFQNYLIAENRKVAFLGSVFDYDPRFSILEYGAAGLKHLLYAFPHFAYALLENGIYRCQFCAAQAVENPPLLRVHFLRPLRAMIPLETISSIHLVLLHKPVLLPAGSHNSGTERSYFEFSRTALEALAFEPTEAPEIKWSKIERLFELAVTDGLLVCGPQRADASSSARIGKTLGRNQAEQFVIERFFALGFRNGHGNEPWLEHAASEPLRHDPEKVKKARKQLVYWKTTSLFFLKAGRPEAADVPGARIRQEALQSKGSELFLSLLNTPVYAPLMGVFLATDAQGGWLVGEPELHAFARGLNAGMAKVLVETGGVIARCADAFHDKETKSTFLFECALGILLGATGGHKSQKRLSAFEKAKEALRKHYEGLFGVSLAAAPSVLREHRAKSVAQLIETKKRSEEARQTILSLLCEPLSKKVSELLREMVALLSEQADDLVDQPLPRILVESQTTFEESITALFAWIKSRGTHASGVTLDSESQLLINLVGLRALAEEGNETAALERASALYPALSERRKQAIAPFFDELFWSLLRSIEKQLDQGHNEKAAALAECALAIIKKMPFRNDFRNLLQSLFAPKPAEGSVAQPEPSSAAPAPEAQGPRVHQAEVLLRDYADELAMVENRLEQEFLLAVRTGSDAAFKRKEKLRNRLQRHTRWGGREPYKTTLKLLESVTW